MNYRSFSEVPHQLSLKTRYVVLIDPDEKHVAHITPLLDWFNCLVFSFVDPADAVSATTVVRPDVIIVSMDLSEGKIQDCMQQLRQSVSTAAVPVLGMIDGDDIALKLRCFENGAIGYIRHPVEVDQLYNALQVATEIHPRVDMRIHTELPVELFSAAGNRCCTTYVQDLSTRGAFIRMDDPDPVGSGVLVEFNLAGRNIKIGAQIKHSSRSGLRPQVESGIGVQFTDIAHADRTYIRHYVVREVMEKISHRIHDRHPPLVPQENR